ncbi:MAG: ABC transporter substrate-binding protein, partial [Candidatus Glassbacteria bacterium]|nr:ABC transporter substrate-binding protein [Candidatus Glassbacteria bacterium]
YQLIPKAPVDQVPIWSSGYGRTDAADGRVFKWIFNAPTTYWSQASAVIRYIGSQEGGLNNLRGKKIVHIYHNSAYGKEANPTLEVLSKKFGYKLMLLAVDHPGQEQKATWLQVRRYRPDYIYMSAWGVMGQVAVKEAASINFPMDHFIGNWWSGSESEVRPSGMKAKGYKSATFNGAGSNWKVHRDILKHVYNGDRAKALENKWGEVLYNRTVVGAIFNIEAVRTAQNRYGKKPMTGAQMRWGIENLNITKSRLKELGADGLTLPLKITCSDHESGGPVIIQQWDGTKWSMISDWIPVMKDVVRPMIEKAAAAYAKENNITPRDC